MSSSCASSTMDVAEDATNDAVKPRRRRRVVRRRRRVEEPPAVDPATLEQILAASSLPSAYHLELHKTLQKIHSLQAKHVALQLPEGLLMYATVLGDVLQQCLPSLLQQVSILGDVTYGACCVDDLGARALGAELLIHYGHSCLVPIQHTVIPCLYVFVELQMDVPHLVECVKQSLPDETTTISLLGTIQFRHALGEIQTLLLQKYKAVEIPQAKPLSPGEVLGCTSPQVTTDVVVFCADGRFHLESTMIANPHVQQFLRYDPYSKTLTQETYNHSALHSLRSRAIALAKTKSVFGIVLGTLGRQGNPAVLQRIQTLLRKHRKRSIVLLLSEVTPAKLALLPQIQAWVQIACPRLSVDWGHCFGDGTPVLSPYELFVALGEHRPAQGDGDASADLHPMDYYANEGGPWSNYYETNRDRQCCNPQSRGSN